MPLLAVAAEVFQHPLVDEAREPIQLGSLDLRRAPIAPLSRMQACAAGQRGGTENPMIFFTLARDTPK